jgi:hypothetical protein
MTKDGDISPVTYLQQKANKEIFDKNITKIFDEQGRIMTTSDLIANGRYLDAGTQLAEEALGQIPSLAWSVGTRFAFGVPGAIAGTFTLGGSVYGQELVEDLERLYIDKGIIITDKEASVLRTGSAFKAGAEWAGELAGALLFGAAGNLVRGGASQEIVKGFTNSYIKRFVLGYIGGALTEGASEAFTTIMQDYTNVHVYGDEISFRDRWRNSIRWWSF